MNDFEMCTMKRSSSWSKQAPPQNKFCKNHQNCQFGPLKIDYQIIVLNNEVDHFKIQLFANFGSDLLINNLAQGKKPFQIGAEVMLG